MLPLVLVFGVVDDVGGASGTGIKAADLLLVRWAFALIKTSCTPAVVLVFNEAENSCSSH